MKTLILMRHSRAESPGRFADHERPLTQAGVKLAQRTAAELDIPSIDRILASSARRTQETALQFCQQFDLGPPESLQSLYNAPASAYAPAIADSLLESDRCVVVIGHNPGIADLICEWGRFAIPVSPATAVVFQVEGEWSQFAQPTRPNLQVQKVLIEGVEATAA